MRKLLVMALFAFALLPAAAGAQLNTTDSGLDVTGGAVYGGDAETNIQILLGENIIAPALSIVGIVFFFLMLYAGFLWMTAGGNTETVGKAKRLMVNAVIGAVLISLSFLITTTIFDALSGERAPAGGQEAAP